MTKRVCLESGCPEPTDSTRCVKHSREKDAARGRRQARGYDRDHERTRAEWQRVIDDGFIVRCSTCRIQLFGRTWDLGHTDDRTGYVGPQCVRCNRGHEPAA